MLVFILAVSTALIVSFLCSIFESVLLSLGHVDVELINKKGSKAGPILEGFKRQMDLPIAAILILNTIAHTVGAGQAGASFQRAFEGTPIWVFHTVFTVSVLLFTEIVPKTLGISYHKRLATPVAFCVLGLVKLLRPVLVITSWLSRRLTSGKEEPVTSIEEIRILAAAGRSQGVLGIRTARMIEGAARLRELKVDEIMVPRNRVVSFDAHNRREAVAATIRDSGHSRFPFTAEGDLDRIEGVVLAKEILLSLQDGPQELDWKPLIHETLFVPETKNLLELLRTFQETRRHLAMVVDEYGGVAGIVTLEDVLEELVGEIVDESDAERAMISVQPDGSLECRGLAEVRKVAEHFDREIEDIEATTVSGMVSELLGRVPLQGDQVEHAGLRFTVRTASDRRAEWLSVALLESGPGRNSDGKDSDEAQH